MREVDRVLNDVDLGLQIRRDVDCRIADDQRLIVAWHVHHEAMTYAPGGPETYIALDHCAHQLIRMQAAFHQRFGAPLTYELDRFGCRIMAVLSIDDLELADVETVLGRDLADAVFRANEDGLDQFHVGGRESALQRDLVARVSDGDLYRWEFLSTRDELVKLVVCVPFFCPCGGLKHGHLLPPLKSIDP